MKCREFERLVADWLGQRLGPAQSRRMAHHREHCLACARMVRAEAELRESWRAASAAQTAGDIWPQLSQRLEAPGRREAWIFRAARPSRWAFSGAAALVAVAAVIWGGRPLETNDLRPHSDPVGTTRPENRAAAGTPASAVTLAALGDVAEVNPKVDDPVGTNMEDVWAHIKTNGR